MPFCPDWSGTLHNPSGNSADWCLHGEPAAWEEQQVTGELIVSLLAASAHDPLNINHVHVGFPSGSFTLKQFVGLSTSLQLGIPATRSCWPIVAMRACVEMNDIAIEGDGWNQN